MAKKLERAPAQESRIPSEAQYLKFSRAMKAAKAEMDEAKGTMGSIKERAIADHNIHSEASRLVEKYDNKSPAQQTEFRSHFLLYWNYKKLATEDLLTEKPAQAASSKRRGRPKKSKPQAVSPEKYTEPRLVQFEEDVA